MENNTNLEVVRKEPNPKIRAFFWKYFDILVAILPIIILAIIQWDIYFKGKESVQNIIGVGLLVVFVAIILSKKAEILKGFWGFLFFSITIECLSTILNDLRVISWFATLGMFISYIWTNRKRKYWQSITEKMNSISTDEIAVEAVKRERIKRSGRV